MPEVMISSSSGDENPFSSSGIKSESSSAKTDSLLETKPASPNVDSPEASLQAPSQEETTSTKAEETYFDVPTVHPPNPNPEVSEPAPPSPEPHSSETVSADKNVFYNKETLKYMRIIDKYKQLGVAEIELPRVIEEYSVP